MNKALKYSLLVVILGLALYNSVSIEALDEVKKSQNDLVFDAKTYANDFMNDEIESLAALNATEFIKSIGADLKTYSIENGKKLGISDEYNFIIEDEATISEIEEEFVLVTIDNGKQLRLATDFIFGNAIRDGSAMAQIGDYQNTMDFNSISVELNNIVRETIIPPFKEKAEIGDIVHFKGAVKLDVTKPITNDLKVIPIQISFKD